MNVQDSLIVLAWVEERALLVTRLFSSDDGSFAVSFEGLAEPGYYSCFPVQAGCRSRFEEWMKDQD